MGITIGVQDWPFPVETYNKFLLISLVINVTLLCALASYLYKTRHLLKRWYAQHVLGITPNKRREEARPSFYRLRLTVFDALHEQPSLKKAILFIGDSLTNAFEWSEFFQNGSQTVLLNRGVTGAGVEFLIEEFEGIFLSSYDVQKIFIMIGINDIRQKSFNMDKFIRDYNLLIDKALEHFNRGEICVQSILPVRKSQIPSETIKVANKQLQALAYSKGICYIDLFNPLADENGYLNEKYAQEGVHLSPLGYRLWMDQLRPYLATVPSYNSYSGEKILEQCACATCEEPKEEMPAPDLTHYRTSTPETS
jgi:lysophospholipase L1-like esterase